MSNKYLEKIASTLTKESSLLTGAGLWHLGQNVVTNSLMKSNRFGKRIANSFQQGLRGVHEGSIKRKLTSMATSVASPEMELIYRKANDIGNDLKDVLPSAHKRMQVGLRQLSQGRFNDFNKLKGRMRLDSSQEATLERAGKSIEDTFKVPVNKLKNVSNEVGEVVQKEWNSDRHPLLKNIVSNLSKGNPSTEKAVQGKMRQSSPLVSQALLAPVEPGGAILNAAKSSTAIDWINNNKYLGPISKKIEDYFTTHQAELGKAHPGMNPGEGGVKNFLHRMVVNPMSHSIKNTSATMTHLYNQAKNGG